MAGTSSLSGNRNVFYIASGGFPNHARFASNGPKDVIHITVRIYRSRRTPHAPISTVRPPHVTGIATMVMNPLVTKLETETASPQSLPPRRFTESSSTERRRVAAGGPAIITVFIHR
mmetsp:Transcript_9089/g.26010  ORF Transcript_9089/g.26010 Transcript_9089/m.26010 type:complete len:117 (-) Transcript_9089:94-444(-)